MENRINIPQGDGNIQKNDYLKNVVDLPRVDNNNKDLKELDSGSGNPAGSSAIPHFRKPEEKKEEQDFWDYFVGLNPEWVLEMLELAFERLRDANNYQDANVILGQIERIKRKYNIETPTHTRNR